MIKAAGQEKKQSGYRAFTLVGGMGNHVVATLTVLLPAAHVTVERS